MREVPILAAGAVDPLVGESPPVRLATSDAAHAARALEAIVEVVVAGLAARVCTVGHVDDGGDAEPRDDGPSGVREDDIVRHDLLDGDDDFLRGPVGPAGVSLVAPGLDV